MNLQVREFPTGIEAHFSLTIHFKGSRVLQSFFHVLRRQPLCN